MLPAVFILGLFSIGTATSQSVAGLLVTRFFGGVFGSAPNSNATAALGDIYGPRTRGIAMIALSLCVIGGPTISPVLGSALSVNPYLGWRCSCICSTYKQTRLTTRQGPSIWKHLSYSQFGPCHPSVYRKRTLLCF